METEFKDWHLYLGAEIRVGDSEKPYFIYMVSQFSICTGTDENDINIWWKAKECKLVLRPLSSLTNEDIQEWADGNMPDGFTLTHDPYCVEIDAANESGSTIEIYQDGSMLERSKDDGQSRPFGGGQLFRILLSKSFDLFELIKKGQAFDSTKL